MHRHDMTLVQTGILALVVSLLSLFTPALLDHFDPGPAQRRQWIVRAVLAMATVLTLMAFVPLVWVDFGGMMELAVLSGAGILQHANVRASYITEMSGRAMSVFTMAMFSGCCHRAEPEWHCGFVVAGLRAGYLCGCIRAWHLC